MLQYLVLFHAIKPLPIIVLILLSYTLYISINLYFQINACICICIYSPESCIECLSFRYCIKYFDIICCNCPIILIYTYVLFQSTVPVVFVTFVLLFFHALFHLKNRINIVNCKVQDTAIKQIDAKRGKY